MMRGFAIAMMLAWPVAACAAPAEPTEKNHMSAEATDATRDKAIAAGRDYVRAKFPDFVEDRKTPVVTDDGDNWQFTYKLPPDMLGGAPVVILSKADLSVVKAYRTQ